MARIRRWPGIGQRAFLENGRRLAPRRGEGSRTNSGSGYLEPVGSDYPSTTARTGASFRPSFRSVFSFAARRQQSAGFQTPVQHMAMQQLWDRQVSVSYLIDLDWTVSGGFQECREREKAVRELRKAARSGELGRVPG